MPANVNALGTPFGQGAWAISGGKPGSSPVEYYPPFDDPDWVNGALQWTVLSPTAILANPWEISPPYSWVGGYPLTHGNWYKLEFDLTAGIKGIWLFALGGEEFGGTALQHYEFVYLSYDQPDLGGLFQGHTNAQYENLVVTDTVEPPPFELDADGLPWYNADGTLEYLPTP